MKNPRETRVLVGLAAECIAERIAKCLETTPAFVMVRARDLPLTALVPAMWRHFDFVTALTVPGHTNLLSFG